MYARLCRVGVVGLACLVATASTAKAKTVVISDQTDSASTAQERTERPAAATKLVRNQQPRPTRGPKKPSAGQGKLALAFAGGLGEKIQQTGFLSRRRGGGDACDSCCDGCCDTCCDTCCGCPTRPFWAHTSAFWGEGLYLTATDADLPHAQQQNGTGPPGSAGTVPWGRVAVIDPHYEPGFRVAARKCFTECSSLEVSYAFLETDAIDLLTQPVIPGGGGAVGSFVHHPNAGITSSVGPVDATYDIDFQIGNVAYRRLLRGGDCYALNWIIGGRYVNLEQDFFQGGNFGGSAGGIINAQTNIQFDGGGLLLGLDGERKVGHRGFSIYAKGNVSPVRGSFGADYKMYNETTDTMLALAYFKDDRTVTILDYEAGLAWTGPCQKWRIAAGYMGQHWFNTLTTGSFIDAVQTGNYVGASGTLSFDGLVARVERRW